MPACSDCKIVEVLQQRRHITTGVNKLISCPHAFAIGACNATATVSLGPLGTPLSGMVVVRRLTTDIACKHTKFDDASFSRSEDILWGVKF